MSKVTFLTDAWLITCVVSTATKQARNMLLAARDFGAKGALGYHARGYGARERLGKLGLAVETEKDVVCVLVSEEQRDSVFEAMYRAGELDRRAEGQGDLGSCRGRRGEACAEKPESETRDGGESSPSANRGAYSVCHRIPSSASGLRGARFASSRFSGSSHVRAAEDPWRATIRGEPSTQGTCHGVEAAPTETDSSRRVPAQASRETALMGKRPAEA